MKIYVKNKLITLRGSSFAIDESGQNIFRIKGKLITVTRKKFILDMNGNRLFTVRTRWLNFFTHKAFVKGPDGSKILSVRNKFMAFRNNFKAESFNGQNITLQGDFLSWNITVYKNGAPIGDIHREFNILRDAFAIDADPENLALITAIVIAIDNVVDSSSNSRT